MFGIKESTERTLRDIGLLVLRAVPSLFMMSHGWGKMEKIFNGEMFNADFKWADPIGLGSHVSLMSAAGAEFACAAMVVVGFLTRVFAAPVAFTMLVAGFIVHSADPFGKKEMAFLYAAVFSAIILLGGGKYSVDHALVGMRARKKAKAK
ncbi:MAG: DoxX family protein [Planctomycetes bacterium]|nr:DoxX family protein [Planctomycetota bacterium]